MKMCLKLFWIFFKLGLFTFGGGYAMIPQLKEIIVEKEHFLTEDKMMEIIAIAESTPGPLAVNSATFVGYQQKKILGAFFATLGVVLPSLIIIFIISLFFDAFIANKYVAYAFSGIKCAVAFLIIKAAIEMFIKLEKTVFNIVVFLAVFIAMLLLELFAISFSSIYFILIGGCLSIFIYLIIYFKNKSKNKNEEEKK